MAVPQIWLNCFFSEAILWFLFKGNLYFNRHGDKQNVGTLRSKDFRNRSHFWVKPRQQHWCLDAVCRVFRWLASLFPNTQLTTFRVALGHPQLCEDSLQSEGWGWQQHVEVLNLCWGNVNMHRCFPVSQASALSMSDIPSPNRHVFENRFCMNLCCVK